MSPKRKIPSRKLPSRKFSSSQPTQFKKSPPRKPTVIKTPVPSAPSPPAIPPCFWDMGFEAIPTLDKLRQRYKELSLVLHPDAGGNKDSFLALRQNYEAAQEYLDSTNT